MKIAVVGCLHGELDYVYKKIDEIEKCQNIIIDLLLVCGDVQTIRNHNDLKCIAVPQKYRQLGTFPEYYFGEKLAPKLTLFVGGNHEASNYLQTLPYGGWVAPNFYYLGYCSVVKYGNLRIGGISGIFNYHSAKLEHFECLPYDNNSLRSIYHMRETEIYKLLQLSKSNELNHTVDIFLSHDWPINIHQCATPNDLNNLMYRKPHFVNEINQNRLGNPLLQPLVHHLKPKYWFAAHLHAAFIANVYHSNENNNQTINTQFNALDKVLKDRNQRKFIDVIDIDDNNDSNVQYTLQYDPEWLIILKKTDHLWQGTRSNKNIDIYSCANEIRIESKDLDEMKQLFENNFTIPNNFTRCKPVLDKNTDIDPARRINYPNDQTISLCQKLNIWDPNQLFYEELQPTKVKNVDEINISDSDDETNKEDPLFIIDTKGTLKNN